MVMGESVGNDSIETWQDFKSEGRLGKTVKKIRS